MYKLCRLATLIERCCIHLSAGYSASQGIFYPVSIAENWQVRTTEAQQSGSILPHQHSRKLASQDYRGPVVREYSTPSDPLYTDISYSDIVSVIPTNPEDIRLVLKVHLYNMRLVLSKLRYISVRLAELLFLNGP